LIHNAFLFSEFLSITVRKLSLGSALGSSKLRQLVFIVCVICPTIVYFFLTRIDLIVNEKLYDFGLVFSPQWVESYRAIMWSIYACLVTPVVLSSVALASGLLGKKQKLSSKPDRLERTRKIAEKPLKPLEMPFRVREASERPQELSEERLPFEDRPRKTAEAQMFLKKNPSAPTKNLGVEVEQEKEPPEVTDSETRRESLNSDMIISCPKCKKAFHRPLVMLDFSGEKPGLVNVCPYCNQVLRSIENVKDEMVKYGNA
jgi:uncharacterized Zn-finger protein